MTTIPSTPRVRVLALVCVVVTALGAAVPGCGDRAADPSRAGERIALRVVPVPASVRSLRFPWYTRDGGAILFSGRPDGSDRVELLSIREDGSELRCLSCGVAPELDQPLLKPLPFADGTRILLRVGEQSPVQPAAHAVLECLPSVADCASAELVPVEVPRDDAAVVLQDQREFRPSPDGRHVGFTQVRATPAGDASLTAVVAMLERGEHAYRLRDARVVSTRGELKGFTPDARGVLVAAFTTSPYEAANPDVLRIDLASAEETRLTSHPDYDEPLELSPDGSWYVVGSGRTAGLFETVWQPKRPNFIGNGIEPLAAALFVTQRARLIQPWLVRTGSEAAEAPGQQINAASAAAGYSGRAIANWHPDGTRVLFWESSSDPFLPPSDAARIVVAHLVGRAPSPAPAVEVSPDPAWAPALAGFAPPSPPDPASRAGLRAGEVVITTSGTASDAHVLEVVYRGFSDDGEAVLDGFERAEYVGGLTGRTRYVADLRVSGRHSGFLVADAVLTAAGIDGTIESEVDGRYLRLPPADP